MKMLDKELSYLKQKIDFSSFHGKTFLITGATGFIGSVIAQLCLLNGINVVLPVRDIQKAKRILGNGPVYYECDVTKLAPINDKIDYIIHAASPTKSSFYVNNPVETIKTSVEGTLNILDLAVNKNVKSIVYISSMEMYGSVNETMNPVDETKLGYINIDDIRSSYSESKRLCELIVKSYVSEYGTKAKIIRLANCFGPGVQLSDTRMFMQFAKAVIEKNSIVLHTDGTSNSNFIYIADAITAIFKVLINGVDGESYNVCNDEETRQVKEIAQMVASQVAENKIRVVFDIPESNVFGYAAKTQLQLNSNKMRSLGWKPEITMCEAYTRLIRYLEESV